MAGYGKEDSRTILFAILAIVLTVFVYVNDPDYFKVAAIYWVILITAIFLYVLQERLDFEPIGIDDNWRSDVFWGVGIGVLFFIINKLNSSITIGIPPAPLQFIGNFAIAVLVAPMAEETLFRGFLQPWLKERFEEVTSEAVALFLSVFFVAISFAFFHLSVYGGFLGANALAFLTAFVFSIIFSAIAIYTNSLAGPIIGHMLVNGIILSGTVLSIAKPLMVAAIGAASYWSAIIGLALIVALAVWQISRNQNQGSIICQNKTLFR